MSYYIPFLSAVRLFSPVYSKESTSQERPGEVFTCDMEGFPPKMRLVYQFIETSAPKDRPPLNQKIESLYEGEGSQDAGPSAAGSWDPRLIRDLHFQDIHPHSWFAVSWYPIYRIPDAPLKAAFLTYHTLAPIAAMLQPLHQQRLRSAGGGGGAGSSAASAAGSAAGQGSGALGSAGSSGQAGSSGGLRASPRGSSLLNLPVVGLEWYAMGDEAWCETRSAVKDTSPGTQRAENAWKAYISELRGTAGRLARSLGARGGRTLHHDYNFFNLRN